MAKVYGLVFDLVYGDVFGADAADTTPPIINSIRFIEGGTKFRINYSEPVDNYTGFTVDTGTFSYESGDGSDSHVFTVDSGEPTELSYTPGNVADLAGNALEAFSGRAIVTGGGKRNDWMTRRFMSGPNRSAS